MGSNSQKRLEQPSTMTLLFSVSPLMVLFLIQFIHYCAASTVYHRLCLLLKMQETCIGCCLLLLLLLSHVSRVQLCVTP